MVYLPPLAHDLGPRPQSAHTCWDAFILPDSINAMVEHTGPMVFYQWECALGAKG